MNNINGYNRNKFYCCNKKDYCKQKCCNNCCNKNNFNLNNLLEIENFLCNFKNICKGIKFYKLLK